VVGHWGLSREVWPELGRLILLATQSDVVAELVVAAQLATLVEEWQGWPKGAALEAQVDSLPER